MNSSWRSQFFAVLASTFLTSQPALADELPADQTITIVGEAPHQKREQVQAYLRDIGVAVGDRPTARWFDPVCPHVIGLAPALARNIEHQLRNIIVAVGAPLGKSGCRANFNLVLTDGAGAVIRRVARVDPNLSRDLSPAMLREMTDGAAPVRWWYNSELRTRDGSPAVAVSFLPGVQVESDSGVASLPAGRSGTMSLYSPSMVSSQSVRSIQFAAVIVDVDRAHGTPLSAVVDYAAFVGLSEVKLGAAPDGSILSLFRPDGARQLTKRDQAFLSGLYRMPMDRRAAQQRQALTNAMIEITK